MESLNASARSEYSTDCAAAASDVAGDATGTMDQTVASLVETGSTPAISGPLGPGELGDEELESIIRCAHLLPYKEDPSRLLGEIARGYLAVFRLNPGVMILEIYKRGLDKELNVFWLDASGMFRQLRGVREFVLKTAKEHGCTRVFASVFDNRWAAKLVKSSGGKLESYNVSVEI